MSRRRWFRYGVATVLILLVVVSAQLAWQAIEIRAFKQVVLSCEVGRARCTDETRAWLARETDRLSTSYRFDAESAELVARAHVIASDHAIEPIEQRAALKKALAATDRAITLRPRFGYPHAAKLGVLIRLADLDPRTDQVWRDAWQFGGNEKRVLRALAEAVFAYREANRAPPTDARDILLRLARHDRGALVALAIRYRDPEPLCGKTGILPADPACRTSVSP